MKSIVFLLGALLLMLTPALLPAAGKGKSKSKAKSASVSKDVKSVATPKDAKPVAPPTASDNPMVKAMGNFDFDTIKAQHVAYDTSGGVAMDGNVEIRSTQMDLDCDKLIKEKDNPVMTFTGDPVKIHQKNSDTDEMHAVCRTLKYDTDKKIYHLIGNTVIKQRKGDSDTETSADEATIIQSENGQNSVQLEGNRGGPVEIKNNKKPAPKAKADAAKPTKVDKGNMSLIPLPSMKNTSTDEQ